MIFRPMGRSELPAEVWHIINVPLTTPLAVHPGLRASGGGARGAVGEVGVYTRRKTCSYTRHKPTKCTSGSCSGKKVSIPGAKQVRISGMKRVWVVCSSPASLFWLFNLVKAGRA